MFNCRYWVHLCTMLNVIDIKDRDIFIMGDIHAEFQFAYTRDVQHACIILAGDCGFGFHHHKYYTGCMYPKALKWLERNDNIIICVRGNHDNPAYFEGKLFYEERMMCVPDYTIIKGGHHTILCVGGAVSIDRSERVLNESLWPDEAPELKKEKIEEITGAGYRVDTIITHTCPDFCYPMNKGVTNSFLSHWLSVDPTLKFDLQLERSAMTELYHLLVDEYSHPLKRWIYGHFHASHEAVYDGVRCRLLDINEIWQLTGYY